MLSKLNRLVKGEIAVGFFCAGIFWMAVLGWATSYLPTTAEKEDCYKAVAKSGRNTSECESFWERTTSDPIATFTLVLAFSTVGLWVATLALYRAGERHSERELRAYIVGTTSCKIRGFNTPSPISTLSFKNSGKTPAYNVRIWTSSAVAIYPMEDPPVRPDGEPGEGASVGVVGPGDDFYNEIQSDIEVTQAERAEVIGNRCAYYVYGQISYRDSFGVERSSTFCRVFAGDRARRDEGPLATYHKWNEAT